MKTAPRWKRTEIIGLSAAAVIAISMIGFRVLLQPQRDRVIAANCQANLKQLSLAMLQYNRDYDEKYPLAKNWTDALQPYHKGIGLYNCPARDDLPFGYALHQSIAGAPMAVFDKPATSVLLFDSDAGRPNHTDNGSTLPKRARHPQGHGIAFLDGHMEFVREPDMSRGYEPLALASRRNAYEKKQKEWWEKYQRRNEHLYRLRQAEARTKARPRKK